MEILPSVSNSFMESREREGKEFGDFERLRQDKTEMSSTNCSLDDDYRFTLNFDENPAS